MGLESDLPIYAPRPGYNPNITTSAPINPSSASIFPSTNDDNDPPSPINHIPSVTTTKIKTVYIPVPLPELDRKPQKMVCPNCHEQIKTKVTYKTSGSAWASCCLLTCFGCCLCCLLPFFLDSFKDIEHTCPKCKAYIGKYYK